MQLKPITDNIWCFDGDVVQFFMLPYTTRMTVIRLSNNDLWVHSPEALSPELQNELDQIGSVSYLISPNKLHHLYLEEWVCAYPDAKTYAAPGLIEKRKDIHFTKELGNLADSEWANDLGQILFQGSPIMEEVVFFHYESKTLILTDLIENFPEQYFSGFKKVLAKMAGVIAPNGKTPIDWRLSFIFGKPKARIALNTMLNWEPENIIVSHGECIMGNGTEFIKKSFAWV